MIKINKTEFGLNGYSNQQQSFNRQENANLNFEDLLDVEIEKLKNNDNLEKSQIDDEEVDENLTLEQLLEKRGFKTYKKPIINQSNEDICK